MIVRAFTGRLVTSEWAARVVAPMSDGLAAVERARLAAGGESFLSVTRPVPPESDAAEAGAWLDANAAALRGLVARGAYTAATGPMLLVYRMHVADRQHTGIVVAVSASAFAEHRVRGHESVHADRVASLLRQFEVVPVQGEMVALLHGHDEYLQELIAATQVTTPALAFTDVSGVGQEVWQVTDPDVVAAACAHLSSLGLYIADGHHRVAAAVRRWDAGGRDPEETVLSVVYPEDQLHLLAFHRYLVGPVDGAALVAAAAAVGELSRTSGPWLEPGGVGIYVAGEWWHLRFGGAHPQGTEGLDVSRLHHELLEPFVGWELGGRMETFPELVGLEHLVRRADAEGGAVFALTPPSIAELMSVADRGEVMLPKSTFFDPKPRGGVVLMGEA